MSQFPPPQPGWGAPQPQSPGPQPWGPGQGPQPGWGQQGPPKKGGGGAVVAIVLVLVVLCGAAAAFFLRGGEDEGGDTSSPEGVVQALVDAANDGDCAGIAELMTENAVTMIGECTGEPADLTLENIETQSEEGDTAVVTATDEFANQSITVTFELVRVDGVWRIDVYDNGIAGPEDEEPSGESDDGSGLSDGPVGGDGPAGVASAYAQALIDGDCEAARALAVDPSTVDCGAAPGSTIDGVGIMSEGPESATVWVQFDEGDLLLDLVVVDGEWKFGTLAE